MAEACNKCVHEFRSVRAGDGKCPMRVLDLPSATRTNRIPDNLITFSRLTPRETAYLSACSRPDRHCDCHGVVPVMRRG